MKLNNRGLDELLGEMDVLANRLVFAVVTGGLLIGSSLIGAFATGGPQVPLLGVSVVAFLGFTLALVMATILLTVIFRSRRL